MIISIAGLPIEWQEKQTDFVKDFFSKCNENPVISVCFEKNLPECHGIQYSCEEMEHTLRTENGELLFASGDWSNATTYFTSSSGRYSLPLAAICSRFAYYNAFLIHASCVSISGNGVLFTGFSGIGKTTQAELWARVLGAEIINGDKAFIREINGAFYGCGLPWKGSSDYCLNKMTELKAIVVLDKSSENKLVRLNASQASERFIPHMFMPYWDKKCLNKTFDAVESVVRNVPIFSLECRADEEAVKITYDAVFG